MLKLYLWIRNMLEGEEGQDLTEYALLIGLIAIVVIVAVTALGSEIDNIFNDIGTTLADANIPPAS